VLLIPVLSFHRLSVSCFTLLTDSPGLVLNFGPKAGCENLIYLISEFYVTTLVVAV